MATIFDTEVMQGFIRLGNEGWKQGWHERNGGNLTYRMKAEEVDACRPYFYAPGEWISLGLTVANLGGEYFLTTGTGKFFQNFTVSPELAIGIAEINEAGDAYRLVWGLNEGKDRPTSEFPSHLMNHSVKKAANPDYRTIYHCHPIGVIALTFILPLDNKTFSRALWSTMTECPIIFPHGVAVIDWMIPGSLEVAKVTSEYMKEYDVAIWAHHGIFAASTDFDNTFGLMHTVEKSAQIYLNILHTGKPILQTITKEQFLAIEKDFKITLNHDFLD